MQKILFDGNNFDKASLEAVLRLAPENIFYFCERSRRCHPGKVESVSSNGGSGIQFLYFVISFAYDTLYNFWIPAFAGMTYYSELSPSPCFENIFFILCSAFCSKYYPKSVRILLEISDFLM
jgi:hypothetical protein